MTFGVTRQWYWYTEVEPLPRIAIAGVLLSDAQSLVDTAGKLSGAYYTASQWTSYPHMTTDYQLYRCKPEHKRSFKEDGLPKHTDQNTPCHRGCSIDPKLGKGEL